MSPFGPSSTFVVAQRFGSNRSNSEHAGRTLEAALLTLTGHWGRPGAVPAHGLPTRTARSDAQAALSKIVPARNSGPPFQEALHGR
jgi:hypothetical protein